MARNLKWFLGALDQYGIRLIFGQFSRLYYGNDAGFIHNYRAKQQLRELQKKLSQPKSQDKNVLQFQKEGYLKINNTYEASLLNTIRHRYNASIEDDNHSLFIGPRVREALRAIKEPFQVIPELQYLLTPEIKQQVEGYYGTHFKVLHVRCWRTYHVDHVSAKQDVYSNLWHNDPFPITLLRYFVYLSDDVNQHTGALHMHSIDNTRKIMRSGYLRRRAIIAKAAKSINDPQKTIIFEGNFGDGCLMNPQLCLHRAGIPKAGKSRDMLQFTFAPADVPLSNHWFNELPPDPEGIRA